MGILLVVLLVAAAGGGAFYYFKILKPKKDAAKGSSRLDDLDSVSYTHLDVYKRQEDRNGQNLLRRQLAGASNLA